MDVELVLLDNQSLDGCCHAIPPEVPHHSDQRPEVARKAPAALGRSLAKGECLLWLPGISSLGPGRFRRARRSRLRDHAAAEAGVPGEEACFAATSLHRRHGRRPALIRPARPRAQLASPGRITFVGAHAPGGSTQASSCRCSSGRSSSGGTDDLRVSGARRSEAVAPFRDRLETQRRDSR